MLLPHHQLGLTVAEQSPHREKLHLRSKATVLAEDLIEKAEVDLDDTFLEALPTMRSWWTSL